MLEYLNSLPIYGKILLGLGAFQMALSGIHMALDSIKAKTASDLDDKADSAVVKVINGIQKLLDFVGYNPEHKA